MFRFKNYFLISILIIGVSLHFLISAIFINVEVSNAFDPLYMDEEGLYHFTGHAQLYSSKYKIKSAEIRVNVVNLEDEVLGYKEYVEGSDGIIVYDIPFYHNQPSECGPYFEVYNVKANNIPDIIMSSILLSFGIFLVFYSLKYRKKIDNVYYLNIMNEIKKI